MALAGRERVMLKWAVSGGSGGKGASTTCTRATPSCHLVPQSTTSEVNNNDDVNCGQLPPLPRHHHVKRHNIADTVDGKCQFIKVTNYSMSGVPPV